LTESKYTGGGGGNEKDTKNYLEGAPLPSGPKQATQPNTPGEERAIPRLRVLPTLHEEHSKEKVQKLQRRKRPDAKKRAKKLK